MADAFGLVWQGSREGWCREIISAWGLFGGSGVRRTLLGGFPGRIVGCARQVAMAYVSKQTMRSRVLLNLIS